MENLLGTTCDSEEYSFIYDYSVRDSVSFPNQRVMKDRISQHITTQATLTVYGVHVELFNSLVAQSAFAQSIAANDEVAELDLYKNLYLGTFLTSTTTSEITEKAQYVIQKYVIGHHRKQDVGPHDQNTNTVLEQAYQINRQSSKKAANYLMDIVEKKMSVGNISFVDDLLKNVDFQQAGEHAAVCIIKSTYRSIDKLKFWKYAKIKANNYLNAQGHSSEKIFRGL